ncbi:hypothetical protein E2C01_064240 [Portunus trituberculatus]|uniref:Secreted protein n=1 Tax=Portunus trituberculatus TaxID=210409 RepID=A0A5B7HKA5_PORTR|nr:hypothetical protein [Portunus trituberculatus]
MCVNKRGRHHASRCTLVWWTLLAVHQQSVMTDDSLPISRQEAGGRLGGQAAGKKATSTRAEDRVSKSNSDGVPRVT